MIYMNAIGLPKDTAATIMLLIVLSWAMLIGSVYLAGPLGLAPWFAAAAMMIYDIIVAKHKHDHG